MDRLATHHKALTQRQLRVSTQPNVVAFRRKVVKNSRVPREIPGSQGEPSCCALRCFMKAAKSELFCHPPAEQ